MKITKKHIAEVGIALLIVAVIYIPLKFILRGTLPHLPEQAGTIDIPFIFGVAFMVAGVGLTVYYIQTPKIETLKAVSLGLLFIMGFMLVHLSQSGYLYPVAVYPLALATTIPPAQNYSFLVIPFAVVGSSILLINSISIIRVFI